MHNLCNVMYKIIIIVQKESKVGFRLQFVNSIHTLVDLEKGGGTLESIAWDALDLRKV